MYDISRKAQMLTSDLHTISLIRKYTTTYSCPYPIELCLKGTNEQTVLTIILLKSIECVCAGRRSVKRRFTDNARIQSHGVKLNLLDKNNFFPQ